MNEKEVKKCPKCGSEMKGGIFDWTIRVTNNIQLAPNEVPSLIPFSCKNCGYTELYTKMKETKEK